MPDLKRFLEVLLIICGALFSGNVVFAKGQPAADKLFLYDAAHQRVDATMIEGATAYDPGIARAADGSLWLAWLEFVPGQGDVLWVGQRDRDTWKSRTRVISTHSELVNPTLTIDARGRLWLSYEKGQKTNWDLFVQQREDDGSFAPPRKVSSGIGSDVNHVTVADRDGGVWMVWQSDRDGQFDVVANNVTIAAMSGETVISESVHGDWRPSATLSADGALCVAWDGYDGNSYNVYARAVRKGTMTPIATVAGNATFEGRAQIAANTNGAIWVLWEEDGENWGKRYVAREAGNKESTRMGDQVGPLHRFRRLHLAQLDGKTLASQSETEIPQPAFALAAKREDAPQGVRYLGVFYERGRLLFDSEDRLWVIYHHFYAPWIGINPIHHVESDWNIYARCLLPKGWSEVFQFNLGQGDAMQRLSVTPTQDGLAAAWTTGRTDRRHNIDQRPRGIATGSLHLGRAAAAVAPSITSASSPAKQASVKKSPEAVGLTDRRLRFFFGDFHRHTDLSLCYSPSDGTIEDAYRYAIDVAPLDFLGITDHTHDLEMGEPLSHIWWRTRKEADRHQLRGHFVPFYSYERSRGETDHNVISLRPDMMRPHLYPHAKFWTELDSDTITIPHEPFARVLWNKQDDVHRPLMEMYQGYRDTAGEEAAKEGLLAGHHFGFIASSDHLSTRASFAGVWAEKPTRELIFRSLQARRTFAATDQIQMKVTCGNHWMGEEFQVTQMKPIIVELKPTAAVRKLELFVNGEAKQAADNIKLDGDGKLKWEIPADVTMTGTRILWVRLIQEDGNRAWSSPMWITVKD